MAHENYKSEIQRLEFLRTELILKGSNHFSFHQRLFEFFNYFDEVLSTQKNNLIESFLSEFIDEYLLVINHYDCFGVEPAFTEKLIIQLLNIKQFDFFESLKDKIQVEIERLDNQLSNLKDSLDGKIPDSPLQPKSYFPLIDKNACDGFYGLLESVSVRISKANDKDAFIFIPSEKQIEEKLSEQCQKSWKLAITTIKKYVHRPFKYHEVIISFDKKIGFYEGDSLGIVLALTFIEELLKFYNTPYQIFNKSQIAFTGGVTERGEVLNIGEDIIKQKVKAVFFSDVKNFVIPKLEETYAQFTLTQLKEKYPNRSLKIIPVESFDDILNRRDLVEIKRINPIRRTGRYLVRNWVSTMFFMIILALIYFANLWDFDDNPYSIRYEDNSLYVVNKNKKKLWTISDIKIPTDMSNERIIKPQFGFEIDINNDGTNEVIISKTLFFYSEHKDNFKNITCFDNKKNILWSFDFDKIVSTEERAYSNDFNKVQFIGIDDYAGKRVLFVIANHKFFPSAVFGIDIKTGKRVTEIFWHSGNFFDGILKKDSIKGESKIILGGTNNGYESAALVVIKPEKLNGQGIAPQNYSFKDLPLAEFEEYIIIKKSDLAEKLNARYNGILFETIRLENDFIRVATNEGLQTNDINLMLFYYFNEDFKLNFIECTDFFQQKRNTLVNQGGLQPPLTYTKEYFDKLRENVLYYRDGKWVKSSNLTQ